MASRKRRPDPAAPASPEDIWHLASAYGYLFDADAPSGLLLALEALLRRATRLPDDPDQLLEQGLEAPRNVRPLRRKRT
jgi:hypothetical protein